MAQGENRGRLSLKLLFWFLSISLIPVGVMGWHLANTSLTVFKEVSLRNQQTTASRFAETVTLTISNFKDVFVQTARLGEFTQTSDAQKESYLLRVMELNPAFVELSVADMAGKETIRIGRYQQGNPETRDLVEKPAFQIAVQGRDYVGSLERLQGLYPALTISVPILAQGSNESTPTVKGVLMGKVNLSGLTILLSKEFEGNTLRRAAVAASDGFLVAHSSPAEAFHSQAALPKSVGDMLLSRSTATGGSELVIEDGSTVLGAYATASDVDWIVYIQQPLETAYHAATEIRRQIGRIILWVIAITVLLSLAVSAHITLPIRELTDTADRLTVGQFEDLPDLTLTNDEIGDLGQSFFQMSEALREKTDELLKANADLEKSKGTLEMRVKARERELEAAQKELVAKERDAAMGEMASVVGHEIRNPLAVINNSIFFIKTKLGKDDKLTDKLERHVKIIELEIKEANEVINEILAYSRTRDLKLKVQPLNRFIEGILAAYPFPPHILVVKELDGREPVVNIDPDEMRQALRNLITNALDVMPIKGTLSVKTRVHGSSLARIDVRDTGPGITAEVLDNMFNPFYTTKARGTGLGLAVVRKALDRHDGKVEAVSEAGKGSLFRLFIPLYKSQDSGTIAA